MSLACVAQTATSGMPKTACGVLSSHAVCVAVFAGHALINPMPHAATPARSHLAATHLALGVVSLFGAAGRVHAARSQRLPVKVLQGEAQQAEPSTMSPSSQGLLMHADHRHQVHSKSAV
jgi:hypothetical protein